MGYIKENPLWGTLRRSLLLLLVLCATSLQAQQMPLSDGATASVLTCDPGNDFYTTFGHSAIRITDTASGIDRVYNYGTFNFDTPNFYWVFTRGRLDYQLSCTTFEDFMYEYAYEGREVREQPLTFEAGQVQNLYILLETNYLPQYRHYCATTAPRGYVTSSTAPGHRTPCCSAPLSPRATAACWPPA